MSDTETQAGDRAAWQHASDTGRFNFLTDDEQRKLILVQLYTAEKIDLRKNGVPRDEIMALVEWADKTRARDGMLQSVLSGCAFVRMKGKEPEFWLTPKGLAEGKALAEEMGLPTEELP
jgi:hypothetical protein